MIASLAKAVRRIKGWSDVLDPGLVVSQLSHGEWYVSVVRYPKEAPKLVVCSARGYSFREAVRGCALAFLVQQNSLNRSAFVSFSALRKAVCRE